MDESDEKKAEDLSETGSESEQQEPLTDEVKRRRRLRAYKALLEAKGQLIVVPDDVIH